MLCLSPTTAKIYSILDNVWHLLAQANKLSRTHFRESSPVHVTMGVLWGESVCCHQLGGDDKRETSNSSAPRHRSQETYQPWSTLKMKPGLTERVGAKSYTVLFWESLTYINKLATCNTHMSLQSGLALWWEFQLQNVAAAHCRKALNNS